LARDGVTRADEHLQHLAARSAGIDSPPPSDADEALTVRGDGFRPILR
jgi:hypothetical protein